MSANRELQNEKVLLSAVFELTTPESQIHYRNRSAIWYDIYYQQFKT